MSYQAFNDNAADYDAWYDTKPGAAIFEMEVGCLRPFLEACSKPYLEIGVGSGRFARALGIYYGIDPARALLEMAGSRGINVSRARGEELPFPDDSFGAVLINLTLCFADDPAKMLAEASRVLLPGGGLTLGLILEGSPWWEFYAGKGKEGHPLYSRARFLSKDEIENLLYQSGFNEPEYRTILYQSPGQSHYKKEKPAEGYSEAAGFVAIGSHI